jgi:hypothetical protein
LSPSVAGASEGPGVLLAPYAPTGRFATLSFTRDGFEPLPMPAADFARFQAAERTRWADIIRRANITLN